MAAKRERERARHDLGEVNIVDSGDIMLKGIKEKRREGEGGWKGGREEEAALVFML
jgi:hypothetical protein